MRKLLHAFAMCQSMFCAIPSPVQLWDEEARPKMLLFLPLIGLEIGLLWSGIFWLCGFFQLPSSVSAIFLCGFPYLVTGFMHLDGFMDVLDAVRSYRSQERRREILKDSHVGSFAVIGCVLILLASYAFFSSASFPCAVLIFVPIVSRSLSALAVTVLQPMQESQYAGTFREKVSRTQTGIFLAILLAAFVCGYFCLGIYAFGLVAAAASSCLCIRRAVRSLGGMNGDISGYAITISELAAVAVCTLLS